MLAAKCCGKLKQERGDSAAVVLEVIVVVRADVKASYVKRRRCYNPTVASTTSAAVAAA